MQVDGQALARMNEEFRAKNPALFQKLQEAKRTAQLQKQR